MSKSGYELRAGLLSQAENILVARYHSLRHEVEFAVQSNAIQPKDAKWPSYPTMDEIISQAEILLAFVNNIG